MADDQVSLPPGFALVKQPGQPGQAKPPAGFKLTITPNSDSPVPAPQQPTDAPPSRMERIGRELLAPILGMEQTAGRLLPIPAYKDGKWVSRAEADDAAVKSNEEKIQAARGGDKGINWERMGLDVVNPVNYVGPGAVGRIAGVAPRVAAPLAGAASAASQPVTDGDFWTGKLKQGAEGAVGGRVADAAAGAARTAIAPTLTGAARALSDMGVRLTPGQMAGGAAKRAEDSLSSVPIVGSMIRNAQFQSVMDFNRAAINQGLSPIGVQMPAGIEPGRASIQYMANTIGAAYDRVLPHMVGQLDQGLQADLVNVATLGRNLPQDLRDQLQGIIQHDVLAKFSQGGGISGRQAQDIGTELDNLVNTMRQSESPDVRRLGTAVREIDASLDRMMDRTNPTLAPQKAAIDSAWAQYKTIERAASMQGAKDGIFTPAQLSNSVRARDTSKDKGDYAKGYALMQDLASDAERVLPQRVPDSGTPERAAWVGLMGGAAFEHPWAALGLGAASAPYTGPGLTAARMYVNPSVTRQGVANAASRGGTAMAPAAAQIVEDTTR